LFLRLDHKEVESVKVNFDSFGIFWHHKETPSNSG
jgi:hypothetical protein